jgi:CTP synthase (UTP-ammonia lyase)
MDSLASSAPARVALVGDRSPHVRAHQRIPGLIDALCQREGLILDAYWIGSDEVTDPGGLAGFDGIWLVPGSPYRSEAGAIAAARCARERLIPFLGTCGGFQHAMLEFARDVCGVDRAGNAEVTPDGEDLVIVALPCSLAGHEQAVRVAPGSLAERVLGAERIAARYQCSYGLAPAYRDLLAGHGLVFSGEGDGGDVRIAELPGHPFFLATLFQPELAAEPRPHPIVRAFAAAAAGHARRAPDSPPVPTGRP